MDARGIEGACRSTLEALVDWTLDADRTLVF
jgi:sulfur relay (sulfurtransferase) complex TusBCD TusD component (DsrE family)